ncbi:MAG: universal stress protein [Candidatus Methanomethylophilaceae archaeon]|nr:universal stress protein [Candidatus Methanomethylophilaceae archaeon]
MTFRNILVPTDGSEYTKTAIDRAVELAKAVGGSITAIYVIDHTVFGNIPMDSSVTSVYDMMEKEGHEATRYVKQLCEENGIECKELLVEGAPVKAIVSASSDYDVIVMGTLGRTGFAKLMMGSVAERVVRYAKCPVMVVRAIESDA